MRCDRLPYQIENCPTCGSGLKFTRAWTWLDWLKYANVHAGKLDVLPGPDGISYQRCSDLTVCPVCWPDRFPQPYGLLWVGEKFYSPEAFVRESFQMGISRRLPYTGDIPRAPKLLKLGWTWVVFAHKHVIHKGEDEKGNGVWMPAIFHAFKPSRLELLIWQEDATNERLTELEKAGVTPIIIQDGDKDHDPETPLGLAKDDKEELEDKILFSDMRRRLGK
jgi:hypothetical protein